MQERWAKPRCSAPWPLMRAGVQRAARLAAHAGQPAVASSGLQGARLLEGQQRRGTPRLLGEVCVRHRIFRVPATPQPHHWLVLVYSCLQLSLTEATQRCWTAPELGWVPRAVSRRPGLAHQACCGGQQAAGIPGRSAERLLVRPFLPWEAVPKLALFGPTACVPPLHLTLLPGQWGP